MITFDTLQHTYTDEFGVAYPSVTQIISSVKVANPFYDTRNEYLAMRGKAVHLACEYYDQGKLQSCGEGIQGYLNAWVEFQELFYGEIKEIEKIVFNPSLGYAGTIDRIIEKDGVNYLLDIKSGVECEWHKLQTAGYALCLSYPVIRGCVYLSQKGYFRLRLHENKNDLEVFKGLVVNYKNLK